MSPEQKAFLFLTAVKLIAVFTLYMISVAYLTLMERKVSAWMQNRLGPNRVGWGGLLQPIADGLKNIVKEETLPARSNKGVFLLAPMLAFIPALTLSALIPIAAPVTLNFDWDLPLIGRMAWHGPVPLAVADVPAGFLLVLAISSIGVYGIALAGWSSNSKYSLLGGLRSTAQLLSYEIAASLSVVPVLLLAGHVSMSEVIKAQQQGAFGWYVLPLFLSYFVFPGRRVRRDQPAPVRPARGGVRADRRVPHRVQRDEVLPLLHRRVRQHAHRLGHDGDPVLRRLGHPVHPLGRGRQCARLPGHLRGVRAQGVLLPLPLHVGPLDPAALPL
jgi:formate hydrogenlyase subunit 4